MTGEYLKAAFEGVLQQVSWASTLDLKEQLSAFEAEDRTKIWDLAIGAYLINPLKDTYTYDDVAKEYLGFYFPQEQSFWGRNVFLLPLTRKS